jgi:glycosyltransferase involved in cell wall biosynthesis
MNHRTVTVSAIIPTRNRAARLTRAIKSVLSQTTAVDELIIVDDGSEDNTREVVASLAPRARYLQESGNGVACARNAGVEAAQCDWIAFLDDDDEWFPDKIELQKQMLSARPDADACYAPALAVCDDGGPSAIHPPVPPENLRRGVLLRNPFTQCSVMMRRSTFRELGGFNPELRCGEDWEFGFRAVQSGARFVMIDRPLVTVHESRNSSSKNTEVALQSERRVANMLAAQLPWPMSLIWKLRMNSRVYHRAAVSARAQNMRHAHYLLRSLLYWPSPLFGFERFKALGIYIINAVSSASTRKQGHA